MTFSVWLVVFPFSLILPSIAPDRLAVPFSLAMDETAFVDVTVFVPEATVTMVQATAVRSFVGGPIRMTPSALSVWLVVLPVSLIFPSISPNKLPEAFPHALDKPPIVPVTVGKTGMALTIPLAAVILSFVGETFRMTPFALSMSLVFFPVPLVLLAIFASVSSKSVSHALDKTAFVGSSSGEFIVVATIQTTTLITFIGLAIRVALSAETGWFSVAPETVVPRPAGQPAI